MMQQVTIEGTTTPSDRLSTGVRRIVTLTEEVRQLVKIGAVVVVDDNPDTLVQLDVEPAPEPVVTDAPPVITDPPARNASREDWATWVAAHVPDVDITNLTRDELRDIWTEFDGQR